MSDYLVRLYDQPVWDGAPDLAQKNISVRRAIPPERQIVIDFSGSFYAGWAAECGFAFASHPVPVFVAIASNQLVGFACYDASAKGFFGPTGVLDAFRRQGIGEALLRITLSAMSAAGYAYAAIGDAGPVEWYRKRLDILEIPKSDPGLYRGMLR